jgi:hypothetical protein
MKPRIVPADTDRPTRVLKAGWHVLLVGCAVAEWATARTQLRKHAALACAGWHVSAAVVDWFGV